MTPQFRRASLPSSAPDVSHHMTTGVIAGAFDPR